MLVRVGHESLNKSWFKKALEWSVRENSVGGGEHVDGPWSRVKVRKRFVVSRLPQRKRGLEDGAILRSSHRLPMSLHWGRRNGMQVLNDQEVLKKLGQAIGIGSLGEVATSRELSKLEQGKEDGEGPEEESIINQVVSTGKVVALKEAMDDGVKEKKDKLSWDFGKSLQVEWIWQYLEQHDKKEEEGKQKEDCEVDLSSYAFSIT
ncbi:hypothetical protein HPP92_016569 [Vanilla planifolia]|uniref:Uncharacterized protein n=1 Tax=Vanilla planifolia TaxID=51239 RepID=A0A835UNK7_VANPL|nr:hypothetical protein HPP92_016569 [Vanilla planifolia]